jgi:hypothetical protein
VRAVATDGGAGTRDGSLQQPSCVQDEILGNANYD